jgi:hypothetical protein
MELVRYYSTKFARDQHEMPNLGESPKKKHEKKMAKPNAKENKENLKKNQKKPKKTQTPQRGGWWRRPPCKSIIA